MEMYILLKRKINFLCVTKSPEFIEKQIKVRSTIDCDTLKKRYSMYCDVESEEKQGEELFFSFCWFIFLNKEKKEEILFIPVGLSSLPIPETLLDSLNE